MADEKSFFKDVLGVGSEEIATQAANWALDLIPQHFWLQIEQNQIPANVLLFLSSVASLQLTKWTPLSDNTVRTFFASARVGMNERLKLGLAGEERIEAGKMPLLAILFISKPDACKKVFENLKTLPAEKQKEFLSLVVAEKQGLAIIDSLAKFTGTNFLDAVDGVISQWQKKKEGKKMPRHISIITKMATHPTLFYRWSLLDDDAQRALIGEFHGIPADKVDEQFALLDGMKILEFDSYVAAVEKERDTHIGNVVAEQVGKAGKSLKEFLKPDQGEGFLAGIKKGWDASKKGRK